MDVTQQLDDPAVALQALLHHSAPDFVYFVSREGRYVFVSDNGAAILGLTPEQMTGRTWQEVGLPPEREAEFVAEREEVIRTGVASTRDVTFVLGGAPRTFRLSVNAVYADGGAPLGVMVLSRDVTEQRAAEERLQGEVEFRRALEQSIAGGVLVVDLTGTKRYVNAAFAEMVGWSEEELVGQRAPFIYWPPEDHERLLELFAGAMAGDFPPDFELFLRRKNEERFPALVQARRLMHGGELTGWVALVQDLTRQKQMEARLRESEQLHRELANAMPQIVWIAAPDGKVEYWNDRWYEFTGLGRDATDADVRAHVVHPADAERAWSAWAESLRSGNPFSGELRMRDREGRFRWFLSRAVAGRDERGAIVRWYGTTTDIDEQKQAAEALERDRAAAEFLTRANDLFARSLDYEATLRHLAQMAVPELAEWCAVDMVENGALRRLAVAHEDPERIKFAFEVESKYPTSLDDPGAASEAVRSGNVQWANDITDEMVRAGARSDEHYRMLSALQIHSFIVAPILIHGEVVGLLTLVSGGERRHFVEHDVWLATELTIRASHAIENARLYRASVDANRMKDEFLATLSHELRTPLTAILGWSRMLQMGALDAESTRIAHETIERSALAQSALIDDILDVSRIVAGKFKLELTAVDLRTVIESAIASAKPGADAKGVVLQVSLPNAALELQGDPNRLQQIVWNLVSNAVKFTDAGGRVAVRASREHEDLLITVVDTGRGIAPEFLPHVFERFRQFDSSTTRQFGGLGLGLSIVRHLAELHGGSVRAWSAGLGKGATFTVRLPALRGATHADGDAVPNVRNDELRRLLTDRRLLVIDDDDAARNVITAMLRQFGAKVENAENVAAAIELLRERTYDAVVTDLAMPGEDGYALLRHIRSGDAGPNNIPVLAVTALGQTDASGFDAVLQKPIDPAALAEAVAAQVG